MGRGTDILRAVQRGSELSVLESTPLLQPNTVLQSRYRIVRAVGRGGMGAVYQAVDERLGIAVALKETLVHGDRLRRAFEREARLLAALSHPGLPRVSDYFAEGHGEFLVMAFVAGDDLGSLLARDGRPFPPDQVLRWGDQLLQILEYLHSQEPPVVHRDIKPQNLKLTPQGDVVLLDFGLAKGLPAQQADQPSSSILSTGSVFGYTRAYAPLEQIRGEGTDPRSDLYSLGATLHHLLTGAFPPDALVRADAVLARQPDPLRPLHEVVPRIPSAVAATVERATSLARDDRPATAVAMRAALRAALADLYEAARKDLAAERWTEAAAALEQLAAVAPDYRDVDTLRAEAERGSRAVQGQDERATRLAGWYDYGLAALARRDWARATEAFGHVLAAAPDYRDAAARLAQAEREHEIDRGLAEAQDHLAGGRLDEAIALLQALILRAPESAEARALLDQARAEARLAPTRPVRRPRPSEAADDGASVEEETGEDDESRPESIDARAGRAWALALLGLAVPLALLLLLALIGSAASGRGHASDVAIFLVLSVVGGSPYGGGYYLLPHGAYGAQAARVWALLLLFAGAFITYGGLVTLLGSTMQGALGPGSVALWAVPALPFLGGSYHLLRASIAASAELARRLTLVGLAVTIGGPLVWSALNVTAAGSNLRGGDLAGALVLLAAVVLLLLGGGYVRGPSAGHDPRMRGAVGIGLIGVGAALGAALGAATLVGLAKAHNGALSTSRVEDLVTGPLLYLELLGMLVLPLLGGGYYLFRSSLKGQHVRLAPGLALVAADGVIVAALLAGFVIRAARDTLRPADTGSTLVLLVVLVLPLLGAAAYFLRRCLHAAPLRAAVGGELMGIARGIGAAGAWLLLVNVLVDQWSAAAVRDSVGQVSGPEAGP